MTSDKANHDKFLFQDQMEITNNEYASVHTVLDQPLLLESILDYAIRQDLDCANRVCFSCNHYNHANIRSFRLVQKCWKTAVSKVLQKNSEPLYNVTLHQHNSQNERSFVKRHGKTLDRFANFLRFSKPAEVAPTFGLSIRPGFFRWENYDSFYSFLRECGKNLIKLEMFLPATGVTLPCAFPNVVLPNLKRFKIKFTGMTGENPDPLENLYFEHDSNVILLLQSLLNGNKTLTNFECNNNILTGNQMPVGLQFISLPPSVTKISITRDTDGKELELLLKTNLPTLSILQLYIYSDTLGFRISQVLEKFQNTLRELMLYNLPFEPIDNQLMLSFPVMPNLKLFAAINLNPALEVCPALFSNCFLKLQELHLDYPMPLVKNLALKGPWMSIQVLRLKFNYALEMETALLKSIFKNMKQLKHLVVRVVNTQAFTNSDHWDSLLTGISMQFIAIINKSPNIWSKLDITVDNTPSLRMLSELESLKLETGNSDRDVDIPLISDLTFFLALMKMPKLSKLKFLGRFTASDVMAEKWKKKG